MGNPGRRGLWITVGVVVGLLAIIGGWLAWDYVSHRGSVPRGTTVGGVTIGGLEPAAAEQKLRAELVSVEQEMVTVRAGSTSTTFIPVNAGLHVDCSATVAKAGTVADNPMAHLRGLFQPREVPVESTVVAADLNKETSRILGELTVAPKDGAVMFKEGKVVTVAPVVGQRLERGEVERVLRENWLDPAGIEVSVIEEKPAVGEDEVKRVAQGEAADVVSGPIAVTGHDGVTATVEPATIGEFVSFNPNGGTLAIAVDDAAAKSVLSEQLASTETKPVNASIDAAGKVTPHQDGVRVDWEATLANLDERLVNDQPRTWDATYEVAKAEFTTQQARSATFDQVIGEFTTGGYSETSGHNIGVIAQQFNGVVIGPGEVFSVNDFTGPRGVPQGYVAGGVIQDGRAGKAVGGGISQFGTTLYNATYFAGMEDVEHRAHSYYISRYPAGREATLYEGLIDLVFRNTNSHPIKIETAMGDNTVTVRILGVKEVEVESISGGQWAQTEPWEELVSGGDCIPSDGAPGFTTSDTRIIRDLNGNELDRQTQTTVYDPQPIVRCVA